MKKLFLVLSVMVLTTGITFALGGDEKSAYTIKIGGSTSVNPLMEDQLTKEYEKNHSNVKFTISATGSGDGIKGALAGTYEIGMSSRELTPAEVGQGLKEITIAIDGIAVIVNNANPVKDLTMDQIKDIYTGKVTKWEQLGAAAGGKTGGIAIYSREAGSGTRSAFEELVKFQDQLVKGANESNSTGAIKAAVSSNADAIGYISLGSMDNTVKALSVGGVAATTDNIKSNKYKIARPFNLVVKENTPLSKEAQAFVDWILGNDGQAIVKKSYISYK